MTRDEANQLAEQIESITVIVDSALNGAYRGDNPFPTITLAIARHALKDAQLELRVFAKLYGITPPAMADMPETEAA